MDLVHCPDPAALAEHIVAVADAGRAAAEAAAGEEVDM